MPLPVAPLAGWLLGLGFAWTARTERPASGQYLLFSRPVDVALAFAAFVYAPIVGYFITFHGDWSYLYLVPWSRVPSAADLVSVLFAAATIPIGMAVALPFARQGRGALMVRLGAGPAVLAAATIALCAKRLAVSASFAQYHGGFGVESITHSALGRGVVLAVLALAAGVALSVRALRS